MNIKKKKLTKSQRIIYLSIFFLFIIYAIFNIKDFDILTKKHIMMFVILCVTTFCFYCTFRFIDSINKKS